MEKKNPKVISGTSLSWLVIYSTQWPWLCDLKYTAEDVSENLKYDQFQVYCGNFCYYVKETEIKTKQTNKPTKYHKTANPQQFIPHIDKYVTHTAPVKFVPSIYPMAWSTLIAPLQIKSKKKTGFCSLLFFNSFS